MQLIPFTVLAVSMFLSMAAFGLILPLLPIFAVSLGASSVDVGLLFSATSIANVVALPWIARLSDKYGRTRFLVAGLLLLMCSILGTVYSNSVAELLVWRVIQGIGLCMHIPIAQALLGDMTPAGEEGRWMGHFGSINLAGLGIGPLIGGYAADAFGITNVFIVASVALLIGALVTFLLLEDPPKIGQTQSSRFSFALLGNPVLVAVLLFQVGSGWLIGMNLGFVPILAADHLGLAASAIGLLLAIRAPISLVQSFSGRWSDRYDRRIMVALGTLIAIASILYFPVTTGFWSLMLATALLSFGMVLSQPAITAYVVEQGRRLGMGLAMSLFMMAMQIGMGVGPFVSGLVMQGNQFGAGFVLAAAVNAVALVLFFWLVRPSVNARE